MIRREMSTAIRFLKLSKWSLRCLLDVQVEY